MNLRAPNNPQLPGPGVLNGALIVLVAAAGGVVLIKVKLLAVCEWCCCHIINLYFKGCQSKSDILPTDFCLTVNDLTSITFRTSSGLTL